MDLPFTTHPEKLEAVCRQWKITELAVFGSVLRDDFGPESDVDVLVVFAHDAEWSYFDWPAIQADLSEIFGGRTIDLVERKSVKNPFIRHEVITTRKVLYAA